MKILVEDLKKMLVKQAAEEFFASSESRTAFWKKLVRLKPTDALSSQRRAELEAEFEQLRRGRYL